MGVELGGGVDGVYELSRGAPALGRSLLEQAEAVVVVVGAQIAEVGQRGLLHGRGHRDDPAAGRYTLLLADSDDDRGVADLAAVPLPDR